MDDNTAIKVDNVSKTFKLPYEKSSTIKGAIINFRRKKKGYKKQVALKNISFEVKKGEFFGIVGRNGSGKSTLLKLISGIYAPDSGAIHVNGKLTPFIELGVGFNPELSGKDNVYLNGALLGFNRKEMESMYDEIVAFAELEKFMEQKLKNYSSGMQVRLAFSIAIRANSDILVLDEVLAVGDEAFQRKCYEYFGKLKKYKKTVILVTHDMSAVERFCNRALLIENGSIYKEGLISNITNTYRDILNPNSNPEKSIENDLDDMTKINKKNRWGDHSYYFKNALINCDRRVGLGDKIEINAVMVCKVKKYKNLTIAFAVKDDTGKDLIGDKHKISGNKIPEIGNSKNVKFTFNNLLMSGTYYLDLSILHYESNTYTDIWLDCSKFSIYNKDSEGFPIVIKSKLEIN